MPLFDLPLTRNVDDSKVIQKVKSTKRKVSGGGNSSLLDIINRIRNKVESALGKYKDNYEVIRTAEALCDYFRACNKAGVISIDTETTGLDPMLDRLVGLCIYTPGQKPAYVPVNHVSYITGIRLPDQLLETELKDCFECLDESTKIVMFNANFDIRVLRNQAGVYRTCYWDASLASRLLNENEPSRKLKALHQKYVLNDAEDEFSFDALFESITFDKVPVDTAYLYAAHDAVVTYELYEFQAQYLREDSPRDDMRRLYDVFRRIEMPCVDVCCNMEDVGVAFNPQLAKELSVKYNKQLVEIIDEFNEELSKYSDTIRRWSAKHPASKLDNPINISSTSQVAILLYDILNVKSPDKRKPRGTGEEILEQIDLPLCTIILKYREVQKLLTTYIDKLPKVLNPNDKRIHCEFNQYGAATGRMSSKDPNLQNIPSHNKEIRRMFVATPGYVLMSSDFSQQEPKCLAALCRDQGDPQMYDAFMAGKDLYSEIASKAFNKPYEQCREFNVDGSVNKEGKERRAQAKTILLGVLYGRGKDSIAEQLKCSSTKAQQIKDSVFRGFPAIQKFEQDSLDMARDLGYVTTVCGRKRRLPDLQLDEYEFKWKDGISHSQDVLDFDEELSSEVPEDRKEYYLRKLRNTRYASDKWAIVEHAAKEGIVIIDNGGKIADARRQCVNSRIQGSAADLTKLAMIELDTNKRLRELGFRLLIPVHDEVIAECPEVNAAEVKELLAQTMSHAAEEILEMPIRCDVEVTREWYGERIDI